MKFRNILCAVLFLAFSNFLFSQTESLSKTKGVSENAAQKTDISILDSVVLGVVEGITEYLPVSSTGHLILTNSVLGLDSETPLKDAKGNIVIDKKQSKKSGEEVAYTMKKAADAYAVIIQLGAILAVLALYWESVWEIVKGVFGKSKKGLFLARNIIAAFMPAAVIGLLLHDYIDEYLFGVYPVVFALFAGGLLMLFVQKKLGKAASKKPDTDLSDLSVKQSLLIGFLQVVAMWPGTSRSMMTILGGYIAGLNPASSAKFSFLLGLLTLSAASFFKIAKDGQNMLSALSVVPLLVGLIVSFICALVCVKWLVGFLTRRGLAPFAWYRIALSAVLCIYFFCM